jgi:hypothetical protein
MMKEVGRIVIISLYLAVSSITGCTNASFEIDTRVELVDDSNPPIFKITGNGASPTFLMFGPYEGEYGRDGKPLPLWEIDPKPEIRGREVSRYSPFTYGHIPEGYTQSIPKNDQIPQLLEGKEYHFYVYVNSANGGGICFRIRNQKAVKCR